MSTVLRLRTTRFGLPLTLFLGASFGLELPLGHAGGFEAFSSAVSSQLESIPSPPFDSRAVSAVSCATTPVQVDGRLDDEVWSGAPSATGFRVWEPDRGKSPSVQTVFKVAYDQDAVYFAVACLEDDPSKISSRLSRRDRFSDSDLVSVYIDPYNDKTTGYNFRVNPLGVQEDSYLYNDGSRDTNWDAVWQAETYRDESGWYAEMRIPFSSIRYRNSDPMTWGLQVYRYMHGRGEDTAWITWDREQPGFVSRFGTLEGLSDTSAPRQLELLPYYVQRGIDPAMTGSEDSFENAENFGLDLKYGVTADLTLNATVQPDFGQVEADPAEMNLSPFETFFEEKRPFFVEGNRFFENPFFNVFYSRRIGTGDPNARIRYAAKVTGKTKGEISLAALAAQTDVTQSGQAHNFLKNGADPQRVLVTRLGKDFDGGKHRFNLMQTVSNKSAPRLRSFVSEQGDSLEFDNNRGSREAYTTGFDFESAFHDRDWAVAGSFVGSVLDPEEVDGRPDVASANVYGTGGNLRLVRRGGRVTGDAVFRWESDQLELNDVGFLSAPDEIVYRGFVAYALNPSGSSKIWNQGNVSFSAGQSLLYGARSARDLDSGEVAWAYDRGHFQNGWRELSSFMQFRSYRELWFGTNYNPRGSQRYETRGGPLIDEPTTYGGWLGGSTDTRKDLRFNLDTSSWHDTAKNRSNHVSVEANWNQSSTLAHALEVGFDERLDDTQYLGTFRTQSGWTGIGGRSYIFAPIRQHTASLTLRSSILFSRDKSLELYLEPFHTVGDYAPARVLRTADTYDLVPFEDPDFDSSDHDFNFTSANLNLVYRWEYRPGSTLFLVWTQSRSNYEERGFFTDRPGRFSNEIGREGPFGQEAENVFLAKVTYWFPI